MLRRMPNDIPIACTLDPAQMRDRGALIDALLEEALLDQRPIEGGLRSRFRDAPQIEQRIQDLIAAESRCCAFLSFATGREQDALWLDITGAPEARPLIERFFAAA
jgi:hypothetical protein